MNKCPKHPTNIYQLNLCNGKYLLCMDCIADFAFTEGVVDLADDEQKKFCEERDAKIIADKLKAKPSPKLPVEKTGETAK